MAVLSTLPLATPEVHRRANSRRSLLRDEKEHHIERGGHVTAVFEADAQDCYFHEWSSWSPCAANCQGAQERHREATSGSAAKCNEVVESRDCSKNCPFCTWSSWADWKSCDVVRESTRQRFMEFPHAPCVKCLFNNELGSVETQRKNCICLYTTWTQWEECGERTSCESKTVSRTRRLRDDGLKDPTVCQALVDEKKLCWKDICGKHVPCKTTTTT